MKKCKLRISFLILITITLLIGCATVPKQSVELSATIGRDIAEVYRTHRELAILLFDRMKNDINKFVDDVYAPYQISKLLQQENEDFKKNIEESVLFALNKAANNPKDQIAQKESLASMKIFVQVLTTNIESYRMKRLEPIIAQEIELLSAIDRSYNQIHYANSIVTGHLSSVVKVHDVQEEMLNAIGVEGLRGEVSKRLANTSKSLTGFVKGVKEVNGEMSEVEKKIGELTETLDKIIKKK